MDWTGLEYTGLECEKLTHRHIPVDSSGFKWNPLESTWNRWGTLKYWGKHTERSPGSGSIELLERVQVMK